MSNTLNTLAATTPYNENKTLGMLTIDTMYTNSLTHFFTVARRRAYDAWCAGIITVESYLEFCVDICYGASVE